MQANLESDATAALRGLVPQCDKHGPDEDRCMGTGFVCLAHPHQPPAAFHRKGCTCGVGVMACAVARVAPIVIRVQVGGTLHNVVCRVHNGC